MQTQGNWLAILVLNGPYLRFPTDGSVTMTVLENAEIVVKSDDYPSQKRKNFVVKRQY